MAKNQTVMLGLTSTFFS